MSRTQEFKPLADFNDPEVMRERAADFVQQMKDIEEQQARGIVPEDYKFLGFLPMPAPVGALLKSVVTPGIMKGAVYLQKNADGLIMDHGAKVFSNPTHLKVVATGTSLTIGVGTQLFENAITFWKDLKHYKQSLSKTAEEIAPVLTEIKGGHGLVSLLGVSADDNELIYAHRRRLGAEHSAKHLNNSIGMIDKLPGVFRSVTNLPGIRERVGGYDDKIDSFATGASTALGPVVSFYQQSLNKNLARQQLRPDALSMITALKEELASDPAANEFEVPGARNQSLSLSNYISCIIRTHQEDMAKLDPSCAPIRKQLDKKLFEVSDRLAGAIREGEISPLMLVRLVGERHVVKRGGRDIASIKELEKAIHKFSGKVQSYQQVPEKEFYENFTKQDLKEILHTLKGEERQMFMATLPDNILQAEGIGDKEIQSMRDATGPKYKQMLAETVLGLAGHDDKELEAIGFGKDEIQQARDAAGQIVNEGVGAVDRLRASSGNKQGVEGLLHQALIGGDKKASLSELAKGGKSALAKYAGEKAQADRARHRDEGGFADRIRSERDIEASTERY